MQAIFDVYRLPIWITEFAPQTVSGSRANPTKHSSKDVVQFINETTLWMEKTDYIYRYAWHDSKVGSSTFFYDNGTLTATGQMYA